MFYSSREVKELGADATQIRSSRFAGVLLAPTGIFVTYNSGGALMKWRYKSELRVKTLLWNILCQQRLAQQYRVEQVHGLVLGDSMDLPTRYSPVPAGPSMTTSCWTAATTTFIS